MIKEGEVIEIANGQIKVRYGTGITDVEYVRWNQFIPVSVGDKVQLKDLRTASMLTYTYVKI